MPISMNANESINAQRMWLFFNLQAPQILQELSGKPKHELDGKQLGVHVVWVPVAFGQAPPHPNHARPLVLARRKNDNGGTWPEQALPSIIVS